MLYAATEILPFLRVQPHLTKCISEIKDHPFHAFPDLTSTQKAECLQDCVEEARKDDPLTLFTDEFDKCRLRVKNHAILDLTGAHFCYYSKFA